MSSLGTCLFPWVSWNVTERCGDRRSLRLCTYVFEFVLYLSPRWQIVPPSPIVLSMMMCASERSLLNLIWFGIDWRDTKGEVWDKFNEINKCVITWFKFYSRGLYSRTMCLMSVWRTIVIKLTRLLLVQTLSDEWLLILGKIIRLRLGHLAT